MEVHKLENAIEMNNISKSFGKNNVLRNINLTINEGTIHALLGENGTGKSTLMNILTGLLHADSGSINIFGKNYLYKDLKKSENIAFVHQELSLVNDLNIYENLFLGHELKIHGFLNKKEMIKRTKAALNKMDLHIDPTTKISTLDASVKQLIEISKSLIDGKKIIILDEPTASLNDIEIDSLFKVMESLKKSGNTLIFISHKLNEVLKICDDYTIMRDGQVIISGAITNMTTEKELSGYMVGKKLAMFKKEKHEGLTDLILKVENLSKKSQFKEINMFARKGEIVGFTGLDGDGKSDLFETIAGANSPYSGKIYVNGEEIKSATTSVAFKHGISYVSKDRKENGIYKDLSVEDNLLMPIYTKLSKYGLIENSSREKSFSNLSKDLITSLSGGNQQKVLIARALGSHPKIVILDNPTQGVDINAKFEIYSYIQKLADTGISFIVLTNEYSELEKLCDRVYIMYQGEIQKELLHDDLTEEKVLFYSMGGKNRGEDDEKIGMV